MSIVSKLKTKLNPSLNPLYRILRTLNFRRCVTRAGFEKVKGAPSADMLECVINSGFVAENLHMMSTSSASALMPASESSMYRFMGRDSHGSFQQLSMNVAYEAFRKIDDFSSKRERDRFAFVIDDSVLQFEKAKAMELCTWTFDHNEERSVKGYTCLQMGWCDADTYLAVGAKLIASDEENDTQKKHTRVACPQVKPQTTPDGRTTGSFIRQEATEKTKPELVLSWIKHALGKGFKASYCLMDSWFMYKPLLAGLRKLGMHSIVILKQDRRRYYLRNNRGHYTMYKTLKELMAHLTEH